MVLTSGNGKAGEVVVGTFEVLYSQLHVGITEKKTPQDDVCPG
jgi:hypothetical protein